jgi:hypothetical protein
MIDFRPSFEVFYRKGCKVIEVYTEKSWFNGSKWSDLGSWGKQKFENRLFLGNSKDIEQDRLPIKFVYV